MTLKKADSHLAYDVGDRGHQPSGGIVDIVVQYLLQQQTGRNLQLCKVTSAAVSRYIQSSDGLTSFLILALTEVVLVGCTLLWTRESAGSVYPVSMATCPFEIFDQAPRVLNSSCRTDRSSDLFSGNSLLRRLSNPNLRYNFEQFLASERMCVYISILKTNECLYRRHTTEWEETVSAHGPARVAFHILEGSTVKIQTIGLTSHP